MSTHPATTDPQQLPVLFIEHFQAGDVDALASLYEEDAIIIGSDGACVNEPATRRKFLEQLVALGAKVEVLDKTFLMLRDTALFHGHLRLEAEALTMEIRSAEVLRRQDDGTWKYSIDNTIGSAILG